MTQNKLPVFSSGKPIASELGAEKLNAFVSYVKSITPIAGNGLKMTRTPDGMVIDTLAGQYVVGAFDNPYTLASCHFASFVTTATGGGGTYGPWGGVSDAATATYGNIPTGFSLESMQVDEWHRERNPRQPFAVSGFDKGDESRGVIAPFVRAYDGFYSISATGFRTFITGQYTGGPVFGLARRTPMFDLRGVLVSISPEVLLGSGYGAYTAQYELGTCRHASSLSGPNGATGPWGGSIDAITAGFINGIYVDQWNRDRAPLTAIGNLQSFGVSGPLVRVVSGLSMWSAGISNYVFTSPSGPTHKTYARSAQYDCRGMLVSIGEETLIDDEGVLENPYLIGRQKYGSSTSGAGGIIGPWGGTTDTTAGVSVSTAWADEWNRNRPPSNTSNIQTFGVSGDIIRANVSSGGVQLFSRSMSFDARGNCVGIYPETLIATITGGSGSGNLPLNIYDVSTGSIAKFSAYNGTFGENAEATAGDSVPKLNGTRIDGSPTPTLSVTAGDKVVYLAVSVNSSGSITGVVYGVTTGINPPTSTTAALYVKIANISPGIIGGSWAVGIVDPQNVRGSQTYELCGGDEHLYVLS